MLSLSRYLMQPKVLAISMLQHFGGWIPDKTYLKWLYRLKTGCKLDLVHPKTFGEKLQWLKLYDRKPEYTTMVDKYAIKAYVASIIGEEYIIPTLGVWHKPEDIEWDKLPDQFVLKTTHGGGSCGVVICRDKQTFDCKKAINKLNRSLKQDLYRSLREWPYKNVPRQIMAEQFLEASPEEKDLTDYKWYCFDGEPKYCQVIQDRHDKETIDFFDTEWRHQEFFGLNSALGATFGPAIVEPDRPIGLETQINIARKLSKGLSYSRIDLYEVNNHEYFGEITFYPMSGFGTFAPAQYNEIFGQMLTLPNKNQ